MRGVSFRISAVIVLVMTVFVALPAWAENYLYTVRPGDTLWDLSDKYLKRGVAYTSRLQELNQVRDPGQLQPGSKLRFPVRWLKIQPVPATVTNVSGSAKAIVGEDRQDQSLAAGQRLTVGDTVLTGPDGNVVLEFADGSRLIIRSDSEVVLDSLSAWGDTGMADTRVRLQRGRVDAQVVPATGPASRYEIHTPAAVSAVRGTVYRMHAESDRPEARAEVLSGNIEISAAGRSRRVAEKFGIVAKQGKPPDPPRRLLSKPDISALSDRLERLSIRFNWPDLRGARAYRVQIAETAKFEILQVDRTVPSSALDHVNLDKDGAFFLKVRGIDEVGLEGLDAIHEFVLNARPEPPMSMQPVGEIVIRESRPEFRWTTPKNAKGYRFQLAASEDFGKLLINLELKDQSSFSPATPLNPGTYFWRLATHDTEDELGPYGDVQAFTYRPPPPGPATSPPNVTKDALNVRWSKVDTAQSYHLQIAFDPEFEELIVDETVNEPSFALPRPGPGRYYMRVATVEADGYQGPYSAAQIAKVPVTGWWKPLLTWLAFVALAL